MGAKRIVFIIQICALFMAVDIVRAEQQNTDILTAMENQRIALRMDRKNSKDKIAEIKRLANKNDAAAAVKIMEALDDSSPLTRYVAISALGKMRFKKAVPAITRRMLDQKEDWQTRDKAAKTLVQIGEPESLGPLTDYLREICAMKEDAVLIPYPQGKSYGTDKEYLASQLIVTIFEFVKNRPETYLLLNKRMNQEKDLTDFRFYLAHTLGGLEKKEAAPVLIEYLEKSANGIFRWKAAALLGNLGDKNAIEPLKKALKDEYKLVETGDRRGIPPYYVVRPSAYVSLETLGVEVEKNGDEYTVVK